MTTSPRSITSWPHFTLRALCVFLFAVAMIGTDDDYEVRERPCDVLRSLWPKQAADLLVIRYIDGATHAFEGPSRRFYDKDARGGAGGYVRVTANGTQAAEARELVVRFFVEHLTP